MKLVFASGNKHKLKEIASKLNNTVEVISMRDLGFTGEIEEPGETLEENAKIKADYITNAYKVNCFADDSGLEIDVLDGAPGVYSARFAGEGCTFDDNINKTLEVLKGKTNRKACFRTVICLNLNGQTHFFEGRIDGEITETKTGSDGFGYDPIFKPEGYDQTFAEMPLSLKNQISHRAIAVQKLVDFIANL